MLYSDFQGDRLSRLGFGMMRLPLLPGGGEGDIDQEQLNGLVDCALGAGVNYFDTGYLYHGGRSEAAVGKALARHPRESYRLADKYPGYRISARHDPAAVFEEQLERCGVEYFDYYLLHNVNESSMGTYLDERWGIIPYFLEQKRLGRIRHLGFSAHGSAENMRSFLEKCGEHMEFCQIQLNFLDWSLQNAQAKVALLKEYGIPVWVMEPVRGGKLLKMSDESRDKLKALRPEESIAAWAFRWLQTVPEVTVVLSGMSSLEQLRDNVKTFSDERPLSGSELELLYGIAGGMKRALPCTGCRYCCEGCPAGLDIPFLLSLCSDARFAWSTNISVRYEALPESKNASACIGCGACMRVCPQRISVPDAMRELCAVIASHPSWARTCLDGDKA